MRDTRTIRTHNHLADLAASASAHGSAGEWGCRPSRTLVEKTREHGMEVRVTVRLFCVRANANNSAWQLQMDRLSVAKCISLEGHRSDSGVWARFWLFRNAAHWQQSFCDNAHVHLQFSRGAGQSAPLGRSGRYLRSRSR